MRPSEAVGILAPSEAPLLGLLTQLVLPAIAVGNTVVAVPSESYPLIIGDLYQLLDTSDVPAGVVNLIAGNPAELGKTLAEHDGIEAIWCFRSNQEADAVRAASIGNMKQVFTNDGHEYDWFNPAQAEGRWFLQHATQVKNIWVPYGELDKLRALPRFRDSAVLSCARRAVECPGRFQAATMKRPKKLIHIPACSGQESGICTLICVITGAS